jgi:Rho GDP-dissociation inhibitor
LTSPDRSSPISIELADPAALEKVKQETIVIKEGVEYRQASPLVVRTFAPLANATYSVGIKFRIQNDLVSGLRYLHVVKRKGIKGKYRR